MNSRRMSKLLLRVFVVSICAMAVAGILALAIPSDNSDFAVKVFFTTATIAAASVCGLACGGCLSRGHRVLPTAGLILIGLSAALELIGMWPEIDSRIYWKTTAILGIFAIACAHLSMLFMANLAGAYRWAFLFAYQLIFGLATLLGVAIIFELEKPSFWRPTGMVAILVAAVTLLIPIFHRLSREQVAAAEKEADSLFAVEEEIARVKKRLIELENKRRVLLGRTQAGAEDGPARQEK
jgi:hypothetical protein